MEKRTAFIENGIYHVYNRGNGHEPIFRNFGNYDYFLKKYYEYMSPYWETIVYCLMPNHFHFMVRIKPQEENVISTTDLCIKAYADFCNGYVQAYNKQQGRRGSLFMRSFKRKLVQEEAYERKLICYIHNNPVKDGFVRTAEEWYHSSYHELFKMTEHEAVNNEVINRFGSKADFHHAHIAELSSGSIDIKFSKIGGDRKLGDLVYDRMRPVDYQNAKGFYLYKQAG